MSSKARPFGRRSGFTLVELLIVIAIIGVLSTIGIPTFRRMIQKSKKSEAQVNLGGLYTAEQGFESEYGAFGNNLSRMGFQVDGNGNSLTYVVGFMTNACGSVVTGNPGAAVTNNLPATGDASQGDAVNASYPSYYTSGVTVSNPQFIGPSAAGLNQTPATATTNAVPILANNCTFPTAAQLPAGAVAGSNVFSTGTSLYNQFTATAMGVIAPGEKKDGSGGVMDRWAITEARVLVNYTDGVK